MTDTVRTADVITLLDQAKLGIETANMLADAAETERGSELVRNIINSLTAEVNRLPSCESA